MESAKGWDCHAHLFGPYVHFPLAADRSYTPPEALREQYIALLARLGLGNGVLVHPSAYGDDYSLLFDVLAELPRLRGVIVAQPQGLPGLQSLKGLRDKGIRALRYSHRSGTGGNFAGSASFDDLQQMAGTLADAGLHAELWTDCKVLPDIAPALRKLPVPVVIDHMGGFDVEAGVGDAGFQTLLSLVESGKAWVKLCAYRNLLGTPDKEQGRPFHKALVEVNSARLVWGSDWPHLRVTPEPDTEELFALFRRWTPDEKLVAQILQDNPDTLYR